MFDSHLHVDCLPMEEMEMMVLCGVNNVVSCMIYPHVHVDIDSLLLEKHTERLLKFETWRAAQAGLNCFHAVGINPVAVPSDYEVYLEKLPDFLKEKEVVAMGEIGFEPASQTLPDVSEQEKLVLSLLDIAKASNKPVIFHTPHAPELKKKYTEKCLQLCKDKGIPPQKIVIDHASGDTIATILEAGAWAAISIQPWRRLDAADAVDLIEEYADGKVMVDSDYSCLRSDALAVPKVYQEMKRRKMSPDLIGKILSDNPARCFGLPR